MGLSVMSKIYCAACERRSAACTEIARQPCRLVGPWSTPPLSLRLSLQYSPCFTVIVFASVSCFQYKYTEQVCEN